MWVFLLSSIRSLKWHHFYICCVTFAVVFVLLWNLSSPPARTLTALCSVLFPSLVFMVLSFAASLFHFFLWIDIFTGWVLCLPSFSQGGQFLLQGGQFFRENQSQDSWGKGQAGAQGSEGRGVWPPLLPAWTLRAPALLQASTDG